MEQGLDFSFDNREVFLRKGRNTSFDLLVLGGGITGAGIALDATLRGLEVCLIEKGDFASGTSSKSTKLIHGGLRYLKQFEFGLVKEVGKERAILHKLAPHLVIPEKMLLPLIKGGSLGKTMTSIGLYIYDFLADVEGEDKRRMLTSEETLALEPLLPPDKLLGGSIYAEYRTDDARLTIEVIKSAYRHGALALNYVKGQDFIQQDGRVVAVQCKDMLTSEIFDIKAEVVVNATGPWVDEVRQQQGPILGKRLYLTKGSHIVVPHHRLPCRQSVYFDVPHDRRMIFAIPRLDVTYIGTTDTYYSLDKDDVNVSQEDCEYLLNAVNQTFVGVDLTMNDIVSRWAGIRPLIYEDGKSASEISRKDEIFEADNGLISIAGGKLTGYRKMAERVVDLVSERIEDEHGKDIGHCTTDQEMLTQPHFSDHQEVMEEISDLRRVMDIRKLPQIIAPYLVHNFGMEARQIVNMTNPEEKDQELALLMSELRYCYRSEMMVHPIDYLLRRSGRAYFLPDRSSDLKKAIFHYFTAVNKQTEKLLPKFEKTWLTEMEKLGW